MKRLLVTGATGCVGRALLRRAATAGWQVRGIARRPAPTPINGVELVQADVTDAALVRRAIDGCDAVVHLASWVHRVPRGEAEIAELRRSVVEGARQVATAAWERRARLIHASTVAVYGSSVEGVADEATPTSPETPYAQAKLDSEEVVRGIHHGATVLRLAVVYGPHDRGNVLALLRAVASGLAPVVGEGRNRKSLLYVENLADRLLLLLERELPGVWIAADSPAPTQREILDGLARALDRRPRLAIPWPVLQAVARGADLLGALRAGRIETQWRDRLAKLASSSQFAGDALDRALGYRAGVEMEEGFRRLVAWYREVRP